jgi:hypothetical protein
MKNNWSILVVICIALLVSGCTGNFSLPPNPFINQPTDTPTVPLQLANVLNARYSNDTIPVTMNPNQKYDVMINMSNDGGIPWSNAGHITFVVLDNSKNDASLFGNSTFFIEPGVIVHYGKIYSWKFSITAPKWYGNYTLMYQMKNDTTLFGDTFVKNVSVGAPGSEVVFTTQNVKYYPPLKNGLTMRMGSRQNISLGVKNMGRYNWTQDDKVRLVAVDYEPNDATQFYRQYQFDIAPDVVVQPGEQCMWRMNLSTPQYRGTYHMKYRMQKDGQWFGNAIDFTVNVV